MKLDKIVRIEMDLSKWKDVPDLVERVLVYLNHLHRDAVQKVLSIEACIQEADGEPEVKVVVTWPEPPGPEPEPPEEEL